ncbi:transposase IS4 family protein [Rhodopirellula sallentina SM41]|uniref:Transposase IS4 family protein n=1 Tax=Rhodopirellula sallentina SM41 TaxID=1263870 RepID=M5U8Q8_9BACT|nr:transposase IS4 family protein [Rhodopirellula sallentina SM41]
MSKNIAAKIIDSKGDYVLALKGDQGTLHDAVINYITKHMENDFADVTARKHVERVKGHGRKDELICYHLPVPEELVGKENGRTCGPLVL